ncbi:MAG: Crp/Fnr family transcriptional regulator [Hyphomicrobiales bacterium]
MLPSPFNLLSNGSVSPLTLRRGEVLFRHGLPTIGMFIASDIDVHLVRVGPDGEAILIHRAVAGSCFAEASLFSETYHCDAIAQGDGTVFQINKSAILKALEQPEFAASYCQSLAVQVQQMRQIREITAIRSAEERVYAAMVAGLLKGQVIDFAATISLTHEATFRALRKLVRQKRVENPKRGIYHLLA